MLIRNQTQFQDVLEKLENTQLIAFDFETLSSGKYDELKDEDASLHHKALEIEGLSLRSDTLEPIYIPFKNNEINQIDLHMGIKKLFSQDTLFVAHNLQFDAKIVDYFFGVRPKNKFCTLVAYWYLDENAPKDKVTLGKQLFGMDTISYREAKKLSEEEFLKYALRDAEFAYQLYHYEIAKLAEEGMLDKVKEMEMEFLDVLIDMTLYGTATDIEVLKSGEKLLTNKAIQIEAEIYKRYGEFNLKSPQQLCEKIYGIKVTRKKGQPVQLEQIEDGKKYAKVKEWTSNDPDKAAPSTDEKALERLNTPAAENIKDYRKVVKVLDTYAKGYQKWILDGRIWPSFNHVGTVTGRLSSDRPNMQNLPHLPTEGWWIRDAFYAPSGRNLIVADESQLEIRLMAHFSKDPTLMQAIFTGEDIHVATAKIIYKKEEITKQERYFAKTMNFSISYGQGLKAIAEVLKVSMQEAKLFRNTYFDTFPQVQQYIYDVGAVIQARKYVRTVLGRKRRIPEVDSYEQGVVARAKRQAVNSVIQGSASDVLKCAMIKINQEFKSKNLDAHILLQVHDELVIECAEEISEEIVKITKHHMEHPFNKDLRVPLKVDPKICKRWSEGKD
jgi:DNA polymerase-1